MTPISRRTAIYSLAALVLGGVTLLRARSRGDAPLLPLPDLAPPGGALSVYHLGHSLVGHDMPAMLAQLAGEDHEFASQLGWGATLKQHWDPDEPVAGFAEMNGHAQFHPAREAVTAGTYNAIVFTEMVEIADALKYHDGAAHLKRWSQAAVDARDDVRLYLYETWHPTDDPAGWLARIDGDLARYWLGALARPAREAGLPLYLVPGGQVMGAFVRRLEAEGGYPGLADRHALFATAPDGSRDTIHLGDAGNYLMALTHYATLYHRNPLGLPHDLMRADGTAMATLSATAARAMQEVVGDVVLSLPETGVTSWA